MSDSQHTSQLIPGRLRLGLRDRIASGRSRLGRTAIGRRFERLTRAVVRGVYRLKRHPSPWVRRGLGVALMLGGVLSFLPVLGIWMLPLGLVVLSDEVHQLRRPRRRLQVWAGSRWPICRLPVPDAA